MDTHPGASSIISAAATRARLRDLRAHDGAAFERARERLPRLYRVTVQLALDDTLTTDEVLGWMTRAVREEQRLPTPGNDGGLPPVERAWAEAALGAAVETLAMLAALLRQFTDDHKALSNIRSILDSTPGVAPGAVSTADDDVPRARPLAPEALRSKPD